VSYTSYLNDVYSSTDGVNWSAATTQAAFSARHASAAVSFAGKMWIFGGYDGANRLSDVYNSSDGATWNLVTANAAFGPRAGHMAYVWNSNIWLVGGSPALSSSDGNVWYSPDGSTWTLATSNGGFNGRVFSGFAIFDAGSGPKMWLMGGTDDVSSYYNDVWHSP